MTDATIDTQPTDRPALTTALRFTPDDIDANRVGKLSAMQEYTLRVRRRRSALLGGLIVVVVAFVASLLLFSGTQEGGSVILALIGIGVTLCNAALIGVFARHWLRLHIDIQRGEVLATSGTLERVVKPVTRRVFNYMLRVDAVEVFVSKEVFEAFEHQRLYTLYRAPMTGTLLSAELSE